MASIRIFVLCPSNEDEAQEIEGHHLYASTLHNTDIVASHDDMKGEFRLVESPAVNIFYGNFSNNEGQESTFSVILPKIIVEGGDSNHRQYPSSFFGFVLSLWIGMQLSLRDILTPFVRDLRNWLCRRGRSINDHGTITHYGFETTIRVICSFRKAITRYSCRVVSQAGALSWFERRFAAFYEACSVTVFTRTLEAFFVRHLCASPVFAAIRRLTVINLPSFCPGNCNFTMGRLLTYQVGRVARY